MKPSSLTLMEFFEQYYRPQRLLGCSQTTIEDYHWQITGLNKISQKEVRLSDLTDQFVSDYLANGLKRGLAVPTINHKRRVILALCHLAYRKKFIKRMPDIDGLREYKRIPHCWSMEEFGRIIEAARQLKGPVASIKNNNPAQLWWPALLLVAYDTALRINAIRKIRWDNIDFENKTLFVPAQDQKHRADQSFTLHESTIDALRKIRPIKGLVFYFPYYKGVLTKYFRRIIEEAKVPTKKGTGTLFHMIRKTTATMIADKLGRASAQDYLGHSAMSVTMRYLDLTKINHVQAVNVLPRPKAFKAKT